MTLLLIRYIIKSIEQVLTAFTAIYPFLPNFRVEKTSLCEFKSIKKVNLCYRVENNSFSGTMKSEHRVILNVQTLRDADDNTVTNNQSTSYDFRYLRRMHASFRK